MNAADSVAMSQDFHHYADVTVDPSAFPISGLIASSLEGLSESTIVLIERGCWWFHIVGVLCFLVYVPYSKHFTSSSHSRTLTTRTLTKRLGLIIWLR